MRCDAMRCDGDGMVGYKNRERDTTGHCWCPEKQVTRKRKKRKRRREEKSQEEY